MMATLVVRVIVLVLLAVVVGGAMLAWRRASRNPFFLPLSRRSGSIGRIRIACGAAGALIVVAMCIATWQTIRRAYADMQVQVNPVVKAPALPKPALPTVGETLPQPLGKARLLVTVTILDAHSPELKPLATAQTEMNWPAEKSRMMSLEFLGIKCDYSLEVIGVQVGMPAPLPATEPMSEEAPGPQLQIVGSEIASWNGPSGMFGSSSASGNAPEGRQTLMPGPGFWGTRGMRDNPLSLTRNPTQHYFISSVFTLVREDDPLRTVSLLEFLPPMNGRAEIMRQRFTQAEYLYGAEYWRWEPGGLGLIEHLGMAALLLVAAAVLLAQVFKRRDLAMAGMLLAAVLLVVAWDRGMLAHDLSRLKDPAAPLSVRLLACSRTSQTFFYGRTAMAGLREAIAGQHVPPPLLDCAAVSERVLAFGME